ncbi:MAG: GMC family oxidoreductase [Bacteroidota bacterium]
MTIDRDGRATVAYKLHPFDRKQMLAGMKNAFLLHRAAGAKEVMFPHSKRPVLDPNATMTKQAQFFADMPSWGWRPNQFQLFTAHQMGTAAMGGDGRRHPIRPDGQYRDVPGLYVIDGSILPTSAGVNPMISIMSMAYWLCKGMI